MKTAQVTIQGMTPGLLMHAFPRNVEGNIEKKTKEEQAELSAYRVPDSVVVNGGKSGELYIPGTALQRAMINGAAYSKGKGRSTLSKIAASCVSIEPFYMLLGTSKYEINEQAVVVPATGGRVWRFRPWLKEWRTSFELTWEQELLTQEQVHKILSDTGVYAGLLDYRPEKKGPFGKFQITHFEIDKPR